MTHHHDPHAVFEQLTGQLSLPHINTAQPARILDPFEQRIEHTLLGPHKTIADLTRLCDEAAAYQFRAVCVMVRDISFCKDQLAHSCVKVACVVDFPLGTLPLPALEAEVEAACAAGADEIDMVVDLRALAEKNPAQARDRVAAVTTICGTRPVKVILETGYLTPSQIIGGCAAAFSGGAQFVKTSTGMGPTGANTKDVALMRAAVGSRMNIKAAGGIRDHRRAAQMVAAGADTIGTSNGPACLPDH